MIPAGNYLVVKDANASGHQIFTTQDAPSNTKAVTGYSCTFLTGGTTNFGTSYYPWFPIYVDGTGGKAVAVGLGLNARGRWIWNVANAVDGVIKDTGTKLGETSKTEALTAYLDDTTRRGYGANTHTPFRIRVDVDYAYFAHELTGVKLTFTILDSETGKTVLQTESLQLSAEELAGYAGIDAGTVLEAKNVIPGFIPTGGTPRITDFSASFDKVKSITADHRELMDSVVNTGALDRTSDAYKAFLADYTQMDNTGKAKLAENQDWVDFVAAAKAVLTLSGGDDFSDAFYTDTVWEQLDIANAFAPAAQEFSIVDGRLDITSVTTADSANYMVGKRINYATAKWVTFDLIHYSGASQVFIYADTATGTYVRFAPNNLGLMRMYKDATGAVGIAGNILNISNNSGVVQDPGDLTGLEYGAPYQVWVKYEQVESNIQLSLYVVNTYGRILCKTVQQIAGTLTENGLFGFNALAKNSDAAMDNVRIYTDAQGMDFNVKHCNLLASDPARVTPALYETDLSKMEADYEALTVKTDVDSRYAPLAAAWEPWKNSTNTAETFKTVHAAALDSGASLAEVEPAISVYNALDAADKAALAEEYAVLKGLLASLNAGEEVTDKTKIAFVGDSFFTHTVKENAEAADINVAGIFMELLGTENYEYLKVGTSGMDLVNESSFESYNTKELDGNEDISTVFEDALYGQYLLSYEPDIIMISLGINNLYGNRKTELSDAQREILYRAYKRMVQMYEALPSAPTVVLMTPYCTGYSTELKGNASSAEAQSRLQDARKAVLQAQADTGCGVLDNYEFTANFTDAEMDFYYDRGESMETDISQNGMGASDGAHGSWALQKAYADYWKETFMDKTVQVLATNNIRIFDHSYADLVERYLGLSWSGVYRWENGEKLQYIAPLEETAREQVAAMFTDEQKAELIAQSLPAFGAVANAVNTKNGGALSFHAKFDNSVFEAFDIAYEYGMIAIPGSATADEVIDMDTVATEAYPNTKLLNVSASADGTTNVYITLNGTQNANLKGSRIKARLYVYYDADGDGICDTYLYGDQVAHSVNATRRTVAEKMITRAYRQFFKQYADMDYTALGIDGITTGALDEAGFNALIQAVVTDKTVSSDAVYAFIKANATTYKGGRS